MLVSQFVPEIYTNKIKTPVEVSGAFGKRKGEIGERFQMLVVFDLKKRDPKQREG